MPIGHDQIFKTLIQAFFREFTEPFQPEEAALIDSDRVEFLKQEHFTDVPRGKRKRLDLARIFHKRGTLGDEVSVAEVAKTSDKSSRRPELWPIRLRFVRNPG